MHLSLNEIETVAMSMLLAGEYPVLRVLREQVEVATIQLRDVDNAGFFTHFLVPEAAPRLADLRSFVIDDVHAEIDGLSQPVGFILFISHGVVDCLECYVFEDYPEDAALGARLLSGRHAGA